MKYSALYLILPATFHVKLGKIDYSTFGTVYTVQLGGYMWAGGWGYTKRPRCLSYSVGCVCDGCV